VQRPARPERGLSLYTDNTDAPNVVRQQGKLSVMLTTLKGARGFHPRDEEISASRLHDATPHGQHESDKEPPFPTFFSSYCLNTYTGFG
jgi:hypothetical protein